VVAGPSAGSAPPAAPGGTAYTRAPAVVAGLSTQPPAGSVDTLERTTPVPLAVAALNPSTHDAGSAGAAKTESTSVYGPRFTGRASASSAAPATPQPAT
jgi:hypothetical protein